MSKKGYKQTNIHINKRIEIRKKNGSYNKKNEDNLKQSKTRKRLFKEGKLKIWNKGLTKKTDDRILKYNLLQAETKREQYKEGKLPKYIGAKGESNPMFNNWSSREPYGKEFSLELRKQIRARDGYRCQQCFREQDELRTKSNRKRKLSIHHIDFNKKNNNSNNLISLCYNCHSQTNFNREMWINYFQDKIQQMNKER